MATTRSRPPARDIRDTVNPQRGFDQSAMLTSYRVWDCTERPCMKVVWALKSRGCSKYQDANFTNTANTVEIRWAFDCLTSIMGFPMQERQHFYIIVPSCFLRKITIHALSCYCLKWVKGKDLPTVKQQCTISSGYFELNEITQPKWCYLCSSHCQLNVYWELDLPPESLM